MVIHTAICKFAIYIQTSRVASPKVLMIAQPAHDVCSNVVRDLTGAAAVLSSCISLLSPASGENATMFFAEPLES